MEYLISYFIIGVFISGLLRINFYFPSHRLQNHPDYDLLKESTWDERIKDFLTGVIFWPLTVYGFVEEWR